jgi:hypothetical protein
MAWHGREIDILEMLNRTFESCARLYEAYSQSFPELEEFWFGLAMEEVDNSNLMHDCIAQVRGGHIHIDTGRIDETGLQGLMDCIQSELALVRRGKGIGVTDAISFALDVEKKIIEGEYLEVLNTCLEEIERPLLYPMVTAKNRVKVLENMSSDLQG